MFGESFQQNSPIRTTLWRCFNIFILRWTFIFPVGGGRGLSDLRLDESYVKSTDTEDVVVVNVALKVSLCVHLRC